jgi:hypothetical protein
MASSTVTMADVGISGRTLSLPLTRTKLCYATDKTIDLQDFRTGQRINYGARLDGPA